MNLINCIHATQSASTGSVGSPFGQLFHRHEAAPGDDLYQRAQEPLATGIYGPNCASRQAGVSPAACPPPARAPGELGYLPSTRAPGELGSIG